VEDLPEQENIQVMLKLPLNGPQTDVHEICTMARLQDMGDLIHRMTELQMPVVFGIKGKAGRFDINGFQKELDNVVGKCMFYAIYAVLLRDYVGKGILKDINKRLRDCRQVVHRGNRYHVKTVAEQHADFMRLVQEFDAEETIPINLPSLAFDNYSYEIKQELIQQEYEPPVTISTNEEQYRRLAELNAKAVDAENKLKSITTLIRKNVNRRTGESTASFLAPVVAREDLYELNEGLVLEGLEPEYKLTETVHTEEDFVREYGEDEMVMKLYDEATHFRAMLSVAEKAMRQASGERAPIECWGCAGIQEYNSNRFHRYKSCPNRSDPRVQKNFEKRLKEWSEKKRSVSWKDRKNEGRPAFKQSQYQRQEKQTKTLLSNPAETLGQKGVATGDPVSTELDQNKDLLHEFGISGEARHFGPDGVVALMVHRINKGTSGSQWAEKRVRQNQVKASQPGGPHQSSKPRFYDISQLMKLETEALTTLATLKQVECPNQTRNFKATGTVSGIVAGQDEFGSKTEPLEGEVLGLPSSELPYSRREEVVSELVQYPGLSNTDMGLTKDDSSWISKCANLHLNEDNKSIQLKLCCEDFPPRQEIDVNQAYEDPQSTTVGAAVQDLGATNAAGVEKSARVTKYVPVNGQRTDGALQPGLQHPSSRKKIRKTGIYYDPTSRTFQQLGSNATGSKGGNFGVRTSIIKSKDPRDLYQRQGSGRSRNRRFFSNPGPKLQRLNRLTIPIFNKKKGKHQKHPVLEFSTEDSRVHFPNQEKMKLPKFSCFMAGVRASDTPKEFPAPDVIAKVKKEDCDKVLDPLLDINIHGFDEKEVTIDDLLYFEEDLNEWSTEDLQFLQDLDCLSLEGDTLTAESIKGVVASPTVKAESLKEWGTIVKLKLRKLIEEVLEAERGQGSPKEEQTWTIMKKGVVPKKTSTKEGEWVMVQSKKSKGPQFRFYELPSRGPFLRGKFEMKQLEGKLTKLIPLPQKANEFESVVCVTVDAFSLEKHGHTMAICGRLKSIHHAGTARGMVLPTFFHTFSMATLAQHIKEGALNARFPEEADAESFVEMLLSKKLISSNEAVSYWVRYHEWLLPCSFEEKRHICPVNERYWRRRADDLESDVLCAHPGIPASLICLTKKLDKNPWRMDFLAKYGKDSAVPKVLMVTPTSGPVTRSRAGEETSTPIPKDKLKQSPAKLKMASTEASDDNNSPAGGEAQGLEESRMQAVLQEIVDDKESQETAQEHAHLHINKIKNKNNKRTCIHKHTHTHVHFQDHPEEDIEQASELEEVQDMIVQKRQALEFLQLPSLKNLRLAKFMAKQGIAPETVSLRDKDKSLCIQSYVLAVRKEREAEIRLMEEGSLSPADANLVLNQYLPNTSMLIKEDFSAGRNKPPTPVNRNRVSWLKDRLDWLITEADHELAARLCGNKDVRFEDVVQAKEIRRWGIARLRVKQLARELSQYGLTPDAAQVYWDRFIEEDMVEQAVRMAGKENKPPYKPAGEIIRIDAPLELDSVLAFPDEMEIGWGDSSDEEDDSSDEAPVAHCWGISHSVRAPVSVKVVLHAAGIDYPVFFLVDSGATARDKLYLQPLQHICENDRRYVGLLDHIRRNVRNERLADGRLMRVYEADYAIIDKSTNPETYGGPNMSSAMEVGENLDAAGKNRFVGIWSLESMRKYNAGVTCNALPAEELIHMAVNGQSFQVHNAVCTVGEVENPASKSKSGNPEWPITTPAASLDSVTQPAWVPEREDEWDLVESSSKTIKASKAKKRRRRRKYKKSMQGKTFMTVPLHKEAVRSRTNQGMSKTINYGISEGHMAMLWSQPHDRRLGCGSPVWKVQLNERFEVGTLVKNDQAVEVQVRWLSKKECMELKDCIIYFQDSGSKKWNSSFTNVDISIERVVDGALIRFCATTRGERSKKIKQDDDLGQIICWRPVCDHPKDVFKQCKDPASANRKLHMLSWSASRHEQSWFMSSLNQRITSVPDTSKPWEEEESNPAQENELISLSEESDYVMLEDKEKFVGSDPLNQWEGLVQEIEEVAEVPWEDINSIGLNEGNKDEKECPVLTSSSEPEKESNLQVNEADEVLKLLDTLDEKDSMSEFLAGIKVYDGADELLDNDHTDFVNITKPKPRDKYQENIPTGTQPEEIEPAAILSPEQHLARVKVLMAILPRGRTTRRDSSRERGSRSRVRSCGVRVRHQEECVVRFTTSGGERRVRSLNSRIYMRPYAVRITERLPHMVFPLGEAGRHRSEMITVIGVFDSGSGVTIGYLPYWESVAARFPELVEEFIEITEEYEGLTIGGIDKNGAGTVCTHRITLKTPFVVEGQKVTLSVALTAGLSCNLIFGLPFILKAKMTAHLFDKYVSSMAFQTTFPLIYQAPVALDEMVEQEGTVPALATHHGDSN
jgi:hypothetical protein